jgi:hypothetical protein
LQAILFLIYLVLFSWLLARMRFVTQSGLSKQAVVALYTLKVIAGVVAAWMLRNDANADTWLYHRDALVECRLLLSNPAAYLSNIFYTGYQHGYDGVWQLQNSYWNDLKTNLIIKIVSVFNLLSGGQYYVNVVLYNAITFLGHIAIFRFFKKVYNAANRVLIISCFLWPSLLLFTSIIHKDGLIFTALALVCYLFVVLLHRGRLALRQWLFFAMSLLLIFLFRSYILLVFVPALLCWYIAKRFNWRPWWVFTLVFAAGIVVFFASSHPASPVQLPQLVIQKQADFLSLQKARSFIGVPTLAPDLVSFIKAAPRAMAHVWLRPHALDYQLSPLLGLFFWEQFVLLGLLAYWLLAGKRQQLQQQGAILFSLVFVFFILLIIGYTVPILWAIIRYRAIYLPFILLPVLVQVTPKKQ